MLNATVMIALEVPCVCENLDTRHVTIVADSHSVCPQAVPSGWFVQKYRLELIS